MSEQQFASLSDDLKQRIAALVAKYGETLIQFVLDILTGGPQVMGAAPHLASVLPVKTGCEDCCSCLQESICHQAQALHHALHALECCCQDNCCTTKTA